MSDGILLSKMQARYSGDLINALSRHGNVIQLVTVEINGATKGELLFAKDPSAGRLDELPQFGDLLASATADGQSWLHGMLSADNITISQTSKERLLGNVNPATIHANSALPGIENVTYFNSVIADKGIVMSSLSQTINAMMTEMPDEQRVLCKSTGVDVGTGSAAVAADTALRNFWKSFGYEILEDVPTRIKFMFAGNYAFPEKELGGTFWTADKGGWALSGATGAVPVAVDDLHRAGIDYLPVFFLVRNSNMGTAPTVFSNSSSDLIGFHAFVPVLRRSRETIPYLSLNYGFNSETYSVFSRVSPLYTPGAFSAPCDYNRFLSVPEHYKTDMLGKVITLSDLTLTWSAPASAPALEMLRNSGMTKLIPLLAPPGTSFFLHRGKILSTAENVSSVKVTLAGEARDIEVRNTTVQFHAERTYSAVTSDWYEQYLATGYGQFKGKGAQYAIDKLEKLGDARNLVHTAVYFDTTLAIPKSLVTRTTSYLEYKKAKEKACETNDFMKQQYNARYKWGDVDSLCDAKGSVSVLFGYRDSLPSAVIVPARPTDRVYTVSKAASPWVVTMKEGQLDPVIVAHQSGEVFGDVVGGATLVGATLNELKVNWQMSDAAVETATNEATGMSADWNKALDGTFKGTARAVHDYGWESTAISGFPDVRALGAQAGFRAIIVSVASVGNVTARLHEAYLNFASRSKLNAIIG